METKINILLPFFDEPYALMGIREVARRTKINHTTVRKHLAQLEKTGYLIKKETRPHPTYQANTESKAYLNLKLFVNLEKIRTSKIIEMLEHGYGFPTIILFGSFAKALDDEKSDIDLCIIASMIKEVDVKAYEKTMRRKVSLHLFNKKSWILAKRKNPEIVNSICNGIVLSGQLEVL